MKKYIDFHKIIPSDVKMLWYHVAYCALRDYVSTHSMLQGASLVTNVTTSRACSAPTNM